jgi:succinate-semialdehyde dehydrogenase/glutarate-semialdehyde dehydrogenase
VEVNLSADILDYYADNGEAFLADKNLNPESEAIMK